MFFRFAVKKSLLKVIFSIAIFFALTQISFSQISVEQISNDQFYTDRNSSSRESNIGKRKIKVGFMTDMPYLMSIDRNSGVKGGYGYDYLQMIANFTNWEYEYVYGEWYVLWELFRKGEIDILEDVSISDERKKHMFFPKLPMGNEIYRLYVLDYDSDINSENLKSTLNGKKVGITADTIQCEIFSDWLKENNIHCEILEFSSDFERNEKFENRDFDAIVEVEAAAFSDWEPVAEIGSSDYYLAISQGNENLLNELNNALETMNMIIPDYSASLFYKNYARSVVSSRLTSAEKRWVDVHKVLKCGYSTQFANSKEIMQTILEKIKESLKLDALKLEFIPCKSSGELYNALQSGMIDVAYPLSSITNSAEDRKYSVISDISSYNIFAVTQKGFNVSESSLIGIMNEGTSYFSKSLYPKARLIKFNTAEMLLTAVADEKINAALIPDSMLFQIFDSSSKFSKLQAVLCPYAYSISMVSHKGNVELYTLLTRGISFIGQKFISSTVASFNKTEVDYSLQTFIKNNFIFSLVFVIFIFILTIFFVISESRRRFFRQNYERLKSLHEQLAASMKAQEEHQEKEKELLYLSETDKLTGIANRGAEGRIRQFIEIGTKGVFCLFDVDKFKSINDNFGHIIGDKVLISIAKCMKHVFRDSDVILRLGGDEFAVFMIGVDDKDCAVSIVKRLFDEISEISIPELDGRKIFVSLGATMISETDREFESIYKKADEGCYISKRQDGNAMSFV